MLEEEPTDLKISDILGQAVPNREAVSRFVGELTQTHALDPRTSNALEVFGVLEFLVTDIRRDFSDGSTQTDLETLYPVYEKDEDGNPKVGLLRVNPQNYSEMIGVISRTAFTVFTHDLQSGAARDAAHQVQSFIHGILS